MRKFLLALVMAALMGGAAWAQESMMQKLTYRPSTVGTDSWAVRYNPAVAAAEAPQYQQPQAETPPANLAVEQTEPLAPTPAGPAGCAGCGVRDGRTCWQKFKAWICHRPLGCSCICARHCCFPPLYLYFLNLCPDASQVHTLPCCYKEGGAVRGIINRLGSHSHAGEEGAGDAP
jgi:hypothetical protein